MAFKNQGIRSVVPICALEKREFGRVTDSWLVYEYREGKPCGPEFLPEIVGVLHHLHSQGYRHDDPNLGNFLRADDGAIFLIDFKGRARAGSFSDYYDFILLGTVNGEAITPQQVEELVEFNRMFPGYWLSRLYLQYKTARSYLKQKFKRRRNKEELY